jgi:hypothetical protein
MPAGTPKFGHYRVEPRAMRAALGDRISIGNCVCCVQECCGDGGVRVVSWAGCCWVDWHLHVSRHVTRAEDSMASCNSHRE